MGFILPAVVLYGLWVDPYTGQGGIDCLWRWLTGHPCPGCGLSTALAFLLRGDPVAAFAANGLVAPIVIVAGQHVVAAARRDRRSREKRESPWQNSAPLKSHNSLGTWTARRR